MQPERDQHPVGETVDERTESTRSADELPDLTQPAVEHRVEVAQRETQEQAGERDHDRHEPAAAEEAEVGRQLDRVVPIEQPGGHQSDGDPGEHAVVDHHLRPGRVDLTGQHHRRHRLEHCGDDQVARDGGKGGGSVSLLGEADRHAHGEQQRQVGEDRPAGRTHRLEERPDRRGFDLAQQVGLPEPQQDAGCGEQGDRQHEALAESLELGEARHSGPGRPRFLRCDRGRAHGGPPGNDAWVVTGG